MSAFELNSRLAADTFEIGDLPLCRMLLMNDSRYPWVILVPRIYGITEIHQLDSENRQQLMKESCAVAEFMMQEFSIHKMNVGALGNVVSQLHLHHVGRNPDDPAWPGPVWGHSPSVPYLDNQKDNVIGMLKVLLQH